MAAVMNLLGAKVVDDVGEVRDQVQIYVRNERAVLRGPGGTELTAKEGVLSVTRSPADRYEWTVKFDDGTEWQVTRRRSGGCRACGG